MNIGQKILELRKQKGIKQEELAAELGVTAAAVSKWENGYTLPDILMLCALADFFDVTTDYLLGRDKKAPCAVIAAETTELGEAIKDRASQHGIVTKHIYLSYQEALEAARANASITHLFASFDDPMKEEDKGEVPDGLCCIESHAETQQQVLDGFELVFRNLTTYEDLCKRKHLA